MRMKFYILLALFFNVTAILSQECNFTTDVNMQSQLTGCTSLSFGTGNTNVTINISNVDLSGFDIEIKNKATLILGEGLMMNVNTTFDGYGQATAEYNNTVYSAAPGHGERDLSLLVSDFLSDLANLPVELLAFTAHNQATGEVLLQWTTASELNNSHFEIHSSKDGANFESIGTLEGAGTSNALQAYRFVDAIPQAGTVYYRLKQVDFNGAFEYSDIVSVDVDSGFSLRVYPNPTTELLQVELHGTESLKRIELVNMQGQITPLTFQPSGQIYSVTLNPGNPPGQYVIRLISSHGIYNKIIVLK